MDLNDLKEIKKAKGKLVNIRRFYKKERQPGDSARVLVFSNPTVYNIAVLKYKNFKTCDREDLSIEKKKVEDLETLYNLVKRSLLSDYGIALK
jgi:hypothetical protein